jgi:hypothetical protein
MNLASLITLTGTMACFDLALLVQAFDDRRPLSDRRLTVFGGQARVRRNDEEASRV